MLHPAMIKLNHAAFKVLMYMRLESGGRPYFTFPYSKYKQIITKGGFKKSLDELVNFGFVEIIENNANLRKPNVYRFSENWKSNTK